MSQCLNDSAVKSIVLNLIHGTDMIEGESDSTSCPHDLHTHTHTHEHPHTHTQNVNKKSNSKH